jgi:hypothetical protein
MEIFHSAVEHGDIMHPPYIFFNTIHTCCRCLPRPYSPLAHSPFLTLTLSRSLALSALAHSLGLCIPGRAVRSGRKIPPGALQCIRIFCKRSIRDHAIDTRRLMNGRVHELEIQKAIDFAVGLSGQDLDSRNGWAGESGLGIRRWVRNGTEEGAQAT